LKNVAARAIRGVREEFKKNHDRQPDVGRPKLHPTAGATVVGAAEFLMLQLELNTSDIASRTTSRRLSVSSGGLGM